MTLLVKHGDHDQSEHGNWARGGGASAPSIDYDLKADVERDRGMNYASTPGRPLAYGPKAAGLTSGEAELAITQIVPGIKVTGLDLVDPVIRGEMVRAVARIAEKVPPGLMPKAIDVMDEERWREVGVPGRGAMYWASGVRINAEKHGTEEAGQQYEHGTGPYREGMTQKELPRSAYGAVRDVFTPMEYTIAHEIGHAVEDQYRKNAAGTFPLDIPLAVDFKRDEYGYVESRKNMPGASQYGVSTGGTSWGGRLDADTRLAERWAEGFVHYAAGLDTPPARYVEQRLDRAVKENLHISQPERLAQGLEQRRVIKERSDLEAALAVVDEMLRVARVQFAKAATHTSRRNKERLVRASQKPIMEAFAEYAEGFARRNLVVKVAKADVFPPAIDWEAEKDELGRVLKPHLRRLAQQGFRGSRREMRQVVPEASITSPTAPDPRYPYRRTLVLNERDTAAIEDQLGWRITQVNESSKRRIGGLIREGLDLGLDQRQLVNGTDEFPGLAQEVESWGSPRGRARVIALTESANAFNLGSLTGYRNSGIVQEVVIYDGEGLPEDPEWCGWTSHEDPDKASGSIRTLEEAQEYPTSHPNCQRSWAPVVIRPGKTRNEFVESAEVTEGEEVEVSARAPTPVGGNPTLVGKNPTVWKYSPEQPRDAAGRWAPAGSIWSGFLKFDPDQPRDESGRWTSGGVSPSGGSAPSGKTWSDPGVRPPSGVPGGYASWDAWSEAKTHEEQAAYFDEKRAAERAWDKAMNYGVATGRVPIEEAQERGWSPLSIRGEPMPLPPVLYHATPALDAVLADGLKTREEVQEEHGSSAGLGGGDDSTISFTTDRVLAERIAETLVEVHGVVTGEISGQDLMERAQAGGFAPFMIELAHGQENWDRAIEREMRTAQADGHSMSIVMSKEQMDEKHGDKGWVPAPDARWLVGGDGVSRTSDWERPMTEDEKAEARLDLYRGPFLLAQEHAGGPSDPLFWSPKIEAIRAMDVSQVGVVEARPVPGAIGYQTSGMSEWRTWTGDAVTVTNLRKFDPDQPRDSTGRWSSGGGGPVDYSTAAVRAAPINTATQALKDLGVARVGLYSITEKNAEALTSRMTTLAERFPTAMRQVYAVAGYPASRAGEMPDLFSPAKGLPLVEPSTAASTTTVEGFYAQNYMPGGYEGRRDESHPGTSIVELNADLFGDDEAMAQYLDAPGKAGYFANPTVEGIVDHEFGHVYQASLERPLTPDAEQRIRDDARLGEEEAAVEAVEEARGRTWNDLNEAIATAIAMDAEGGVGPGLPSGYAMRAADRGNTGEIFAEGFSEAMSPAKTPFLSYLGRSFREILSRDDVWKFDPDQPRDESGRWSSSGGGVSAPDRPQPGDAIPAPKGMMAPSVPASALPVGYGKQEDGRRQIYAGTEQAEGIQRQYGQLIRGHEVIGPTDARIPDTVYHVTTNLSAVVDSGYLRASGEGGLGGDTEDKIVSMTTDHDIATQLAADLAFNAKVEQSPITDVPAILSAQAKAEGWSEHWEKNAVAMGHLGYDQHDYMTAYFTSRDIGAGIRNPIIFGEAGKTVDISDIGVVAIPKANLDNGALLVDFDLEPGSRYSLQEIRSYGDVSLAGGKVTKFDEDQPRDPSGRWTSGGGGGAGGGASGAPDPPVHVTDLSEPRQYQNAYEATIEDKFGIIADFRDEQGTAAIRNPSLEAIGGHSSVREIDEGLQQVVLDRLATLERDGFDIREAKIVTWTDPLSGAPNHMRVGSFADVYREPGTDFTEVRLNVYRWANEEEFRQSLAESESKGWLSVGTPEGVVDHEMAHAMSDDHKDFMRQQGEKYGIPEEGRPPEGGSVPHPQDRSKFGTPSTYATTNWQEFWAESFSEARSDRPTSALSQAGRETREYLASIVGKHADHDQSTHGNREGSTNREDYGMQHRPTEGYGGRGDDLTTLVSEEVYQHPEWYGGEGYPEVVAQMQAMRGNPDAPVTIYRAVPIEVKGGINRGDWITLDRKYAKEHGESNLTEPNAQGVYDRPEGQNEGHSYRIITQQATAKDVQWPGDWLPEWGYFPQEVEKHGDHDQSTHGNWATGEGGTKEPGAEAAWRAKGQLDAPDHMADFTQKAQDKIMARADAIAAKTTRDDGHKIDAKHPGFPRDPAEMATVVLAAYDRATPEEIKAGMTWYQDAHDAVKAVSDDTGIDFDQALAITAACSPLRLWDANISIADRIMVTVVADEPFELTEEKYASLRNQEGLDGPGIVRPSDLAPDQLAWAHPNLSGEGGASLDHYKQVATGIELARGDKTPDEALTGPKVRNFYNNMRDPEDPFSVTIDGHQVAVQIPRGLMVPDGTKMIESEDAGSGFMRSSPSITSVKTGDELPHGTGMYPFYATAAQMAAAEKGILPQQMQAVTWLVEIREADAREREQRAERYARQKAERAAAA